jgi:hypothetical protein
MEEQSLIIKLVLSFVNYVLLECDAIEACK